MTPAARRTAAVVLLALAGLVVAVVLAIVVAGSVSHAVALGGTDLGNGRNLVVTQTATTVVSPPANPAAPIGGRGGNDHDKDNSGKAGGGRDHDDDD